MLQFPEKCYTFQFLLNRCFPLHLIVRLAIESIYHKVFILKILSHDLDYEVQFSLFSRLVLVLNLVVNKMFDMLPISIHEALRLTVRFSMKRWQFSVGFLLINCIISFCSS